MRQENIMKRLMEFPDIENQWETKAVENKWLALVDEKE